MSEIVRPLLWYTSGTPINVGQHDCSYARWLGYHAGRHGTGYRSKATAVPLATGSGVHKGIQLIGEWILDWQNAHANQRLTSCPDEVVAWAATEAADGYQKTATARGLELTKTDVDSMAAVTQLILEQRTLIEAQVWIYAIVRLPYMLATRRVLNVEFEEAPVIDCTCGLGDWFGQDVDHAARGCRGIVAQGKADFLWEVVDGDKSQIGQIEYEEFKTKATPNYGWDNAWEHSGQLFRNMEAASLRLGRDVATAYVPVLYKGKRDRWDREDKTAPKVQQSPLVYGYYDPGNDMSRPATWAARYKWYDDWGKGHTLPRTFTRQPIWDESLPLSGEMPNGDVTFRPDASRVERWVKGWITPAQHMDLIKVLGPFPKPRALVQDYQQSMLTEERRWRSEVEYARSLNLFDPQDHFVGDEGDVITPADIFARSWQCTRFDGSSCSYKWVCFKEVGWEQGLLSSDRYEIRTPHHEPEKTAFEKGGVTFPVTEGEDDAEE